MQQGSADRSSTTRSTCSRLDGEPLVDLPLARAARAARAACSTPRAPDRAVSEAFDDGAALLEAAQAQGLEGIVAKRRRLAATAAGRRSARLAQGEDPRAPGVRRRRLHARQGRRASSFGSLVLAVQRGRRAALRRQRRHRLRRAGDRPAAEAAASRSSGATSPFPEAPKMPRVRKADVVWVEPQLVAEVEFGEWTHDGRLRAPVATWAFATTSRRARCGASARRRRSARRGDARAPAVEPRQGLLARRGHHEGRPARLLPQVAPVLVPHLRRPAVHDAALPRRHRRQGLLPEGRAVAHAGLDPDASARSSRPRDGGRSSGSRSRSSNDELALLWMANMGCIDMNAWYSRADRPDRPDFVLFDLDPTPEVRGRRRSRSRCSCKRLLDGARPRLASRRRRGGKGFHVLVPLDRRSTYDDARAFAELVAAAIARAHPELATTSGRRRRGAAS